MAFECNSVGYQFSGSPVTQVSTVNIVTGQVTFKANLPIQINATGFNPTDNLTYLIDGTISGIVWYDLNFNGLYDLGEPLERNALIELYDTTNPTTPVAFITTDTSGAYNFSNVIFRDYFIKVTAPNGYKFTIPFVGTNPLINSAINPNTGVSLNFSISEDNPTQIINAGIIYDEFKISGVAFYDCNNNNILDDSDTVLAGVNVILLGSNTQQISPTITNHNGYYEFTNLIPGTYYVKFIAPPSMSFITQDLSEYGSKPDPTTGITNIINLTNSDILNIYSGFKGSITQDFKYCQNLNNICGCSCNSCGCGCG